MINKRYLAKTALRVWKTETTAEMFIEQHKDVHFAKTDKSPKVELVSNNKDIEMEITRCKDCGYTSISSADYCISCGSSNTYKDALTYEEYTNDT